jgi:hypothetical protein
MRHRPIPVPWLVLLVGATACQDAPLTPSPAAPEPRFTVAGGGENDLRSGYDYVCTLRSGTVACFGDRSDGQPTGVYRASTGTFVQLSTGATHACALRSDGAVQCVGLNDHGQAPALRRSAAGSYTSASAGLSHTCAVRTDGMVECWGWNNTGQAPPVVAPQTGRFTQVTASATSSCALRTDGVVECWGYYKTAPPIQRAPSGSYYVKLGDALGNIICAMTSAGGADCWGYLPGLHAGPYVQVSAGGSHLCARRASGVSECWGYPYSWQGPGERSVTTRAWSRIAAGSYHTCGLRADGYFECFGVQTIGSNAPDVIPVADPPRTILTTGSWIRVIWRDVNSNELRSEVDRSVADRDRNPTTWTRIGVVAANQAIFSDSVAVGATYVYRVRVCNNAGCSGWAQSNATPVPATAPPAPAPVAAAGYRCGLASCARVTWTVDNTFVETFRLQRAVNTGSGYGAWQELAPQSRTATSFDDYGLTPGARYQYRVQACNGRGCSAYGASNAIVAPAPLPPSAPADLSAGAMGSTMYVAWGDVANETTYELQRRQYDGAAWGAWSAPIIRTMNVTTQEDRVAPGTLYQYRIRACNDGGCSAYTYSAPVQA